MVKKILFLRHKLVTDGADFQTKYYDQENGYVKANWLSTRLEQAFADLNNVNTL
jgi:hypothetical protein